MGASTKTWWDLSPSQRDLLMDVLGNIRNSTIGIGLQRMRTKYASELAAGLVSEDAVNELALSRVSMLDEAVDALSDLVERAKRTEAPPTPTKEPLAVVKWRRLPKVFRDEALMLVNTSAEATSRITYQRYCDELMREGKPKVSEAEFRSGQVATRALLSIAIEALRALAP